MWHLVLKLVVFINHHRKFFGNFVSNALEIRTIEKLLHSLLRISLKLWNFDFQVCILSNKLSDFGLAFRIDLIYGVKFVFNSLVFFFQTFVKFFCLFQLPTKFWSLIQSFLLLLNCFFVNWSLLWNECIWIRLKLLLEVLDLRLGLL